MRKTIICTLLLMLVLVWANEEIIAVEAEDIHFMTEHFPPFNIEKNGEAAGITVDILKEIFDRLGISPEIDVLPWAQGYNRVQEVENTALFGMARTEAREDNFLWVGPIMPFKSEVVGLAEDEIKIESYADFEEYTIGTIRDDVMEEMLIEEGVPMEVLDRSSELSSNIRQLERGRIDLIAYTTAVILWEAGQMGLDPAQFESVFLMDELHLYYAFHIDTPDEIIDTFQEKLDKLHEEGTVQEIIDSYLQ